MASAMPTWTSSQGSSERYDQRVNLHASLVELSLRVDGKEKNPRVEVFVALYRQRLGAARPHLKSLVRRLGSLERISYISELLVNFPSKLNNNI